MKCAALLVCAGCNSWFGLDPTTEIIPDSPVSIDAPPPTATFGVAYRVGLTADTTGTTSDVAIPNATMRAGTTVLEDVPYADGNVTVPLALTTAPWRLEIGAPGRTPIEVQWMPAAGQVCIPRWGRLDRDPLTGDHHIFMTANTSGMHKPSILTSGVWTQRELSSTNNNVDLVWAPNIVTPMDGDLAPIAAPDWMMLVDYSTSADDPDLREATAYARVPAVLDAAVPVNLIGTFIPKQFYVQLSSNAAFTLFMAAGVTTADLYNASVGLIASDTMLAQPLEGGPAKMWALARYGKTPATSAFHVIETDLMLPHATQLRRISRRPYGSLNLDSALERFDVGGKTAYPDAPGNDVPVGIATAIHLDELGISPSPAGPASVTMSPPTTDPKVGWTVIGGTSDLAVVTLSEVQTTALVQVKQFVTTGASVTVDKALLAVGHDYVFEITLRTGMPNAMAGDLCTVAYPMFDTQLFSQVLQVR